jgi:hypothetical protein
LPLNCFAIPGSSVECTNKDKQTKQANCTICPGIVCRLLWNESTNKKDRNCSGSTEWKPEFLRDQLNRVVDGFDPQEGNWLGDIFGGDVESDKTNSKTEPDKEGNQPAKVISVKAKSCNPPAERKISLLLVKDERGVKATRTRS